MDINLSKENLIKLLKQCAIGHEDICPICGRSLNSQLHTINCELNKLIQFLENSQK